MSAAERKLRSAVFAVAIGAVQLAAGPNRTMGQAVSREMHIGQLEGPPEYTFGLIGGLDVFPDGRLLVLDSRDLMLRTYDQSGHYLESFGHGGEGPGEFRLPRPPVITAEAVLVYDEILRRLVTFTHDGEHIRTEPFEDSIRGIIRLHPLSANRWIAQVGADWGADILALSAGRIRSEDAGMGSLLLRTPTRTDTLARYRTGAVFWRDQDGLSFGPVPGVSIADPVTWVPGGDSIVVTVDAVRGTVRWYRTDARGLRLVYERELGLEPQRAAFESLDSFEESLHRPSRVTFLTPSYRPYFTNCLIDEKGQVWLHVVSGPAAHGQANVYRVVPPRGPVRDIELPGAFTPAVIRNGLLYGVSKDQYDVQYVDVYRYERQRGGDARPESPDTARFR